MLFLCTVKCSVKTKGDVVKTPRLCVLMPAYNATYLHDAFIGLGSQSFKGFDVVVSDDSPNGEVSSRLDEIRSLGMLDGLSVSLINGPRINSRLNHMSLDRGYSCFYDFVHFHHDDDYVYPTFYEDHLRAHEAGDFSVSVSQRWIADKSNRPIGKPVNVSFHGDNRMLVPLSLETLAKSCLPDAVNWLGELTNAVFKPKGKLIFPNPPTSASSINYFGLLDIGSFFESAGESNIVYIRNWLSNWRSHPAQSTHQVASHGIRLAVSCWCAYAINAHNSGLISDSELRSAIERQRSFFLRRISADNFFETPMSILKDVYQIEQVKNRYLDWWLSVLETDRQYIAQYFAESGN